MQPTEARFREVERQLDLAIQTSASIFQGRGVSINDSSWRTYDYRNPGLMWEQVLQRQWELDLETAMVEVRLTYMEPVTLNQDEEVKVSLRAQKFRPGQVSSIDTRSTIVVSLKALLGKEVAEVAIPQLEQGSKIVGQTL